MRTAELINLVYFFFLIALAWVRPLAASRRAKATALAVTASAIVWGAQFLGRALQPLPASVIRDWLPAPIFLVAYWTAGLFFTAPNEELQDRLMRFDGKILRRLRQYREGAGVPAWAAVWFELAYHLCYPLVPFGLGVLYLLRMGRYSDGFWTIVLPAAYLCDAALPFLQTIPPRMMQAGEEPVLPATKVREFNVWILRRGSIQANTLPSAHVATAFSVSLVLLYLAPWAGVVFLFVSIGIALGAVLGRYHYAVDALLGAALALVSFLAGLARL
jgi:hypothetical protein